MSSFDTVNQDWLVRFVEHRIGDRRIVRLIRKWLAAGVLEDGQVIETEEGTPQGAVISPLLANIYLHYIYDLWVHQWRQRCAIGEVAVVRYADDTIVGFEHRHEAEQFLADLKGRLARFGLTLHPDKTRLIEFGRSAIANRRARGLGKPESSITARPDGMAAASYSGGSRSESACAPSFARSKDACRRCATMGSKRQGRWLAQVLRGWLGYYAVPMSAAAITAFRHHMIERWLKVLRRCSQRTRRSLSWGRMKQIAERYLPYPRILHPWPEQRFLVTIQGKSPVR